MMRLHYIPGSAAMAPHAALAEAGAEYALVRLEEAEPGQRPAEYRTLNPWGQVPTLEDGDLVLTEAAAIMLHVLPVSRTHFFMKLVRAAPCKFLSVARE